MFVGLCSDRIDVSVVDPDDYPIVDEFFNFSDARASRSRFF